MKVWDCHLVQRDGHGARGPNGHASAHVQNLQQRARMDETARW